MSEEDGIELIQLRGETIAAKPENGVMPIHDPNCVVSLQVEDSKENIKIFMAVSVFNEVLDYSKQDIAKELGGVLIGEYSRENKAEFIKITDFLIAKHTQRDGTYIKFTPETWSNIDVEMKAKRFWNKRIVGWYHTHPGWGVFLSEDDLFIQRNFFDLPWQIALVVDPIKNEQGLFVWEGGNVVKSKDFYFYAHKNNDQETKACIRDVCVSTTRSQESEESRQNSLQETDRNDEMPVVPSGKLWLVCSGCFFAGMGIALMILKMFR